MSKQLTVNLVFNANTQQAKAQMQQLQTSMQQVQTAFNQKISMTGLTSELSKAQDAVISLKTSLNSAFDVNTGKLDLNKFNTSLQNSKMSLGDYRRALQQLGPEGQKAFNQLTQSIINGQMPLQQTNGLLNSMMNTFANTAKWMIASKAINAVTRGFQDAFSYAKDLNESLTNIRVVTGKSMEEMDKFAEKANKAAKSLSASTTAYTDAALIYYQQGLEGKAVEERAETTLKLANVTGQSAEEISQQLTAVWNNFYDGSKSIEYYADVMTALGAATASSSDEIAQGLEKFAAVAETVGLSYEYATSALATVTAQTRQSADVVGTAFKTLFARIQDLELGKTLDDGTTLGSYSEALSKVGVNIKNTDGSMKTMNETLDEMGAKWKTLGQDQQVALAKSVAGIRQYTQLIALMKNYDEFKINVGIAESATGTLEEQQKIWAEGWEGASKRVKASAEDIYKSLINDEFFIDLNNILADLLDGLDEFIDAMGGLKSLLPMIAAGMLKAFGPAVLSSVKNFTASIKGPTKEQQAAASSLRNTAIREAEIMAGDTDTQVGYAAQSNLQAQKATLEGVEGITRRLSEAEITRVQELLDQNKHHQEAVMFMAEQLDLIQKQNDKLRERAQEAKTDASAQKSDILNQVDDDDARRALEEKMTQMESDMGSAAKAQTGLNDFLQKDSNRHEGSAKELLSSFKGMDQTVLTGAIGKDNMSALENLSKGKGTAKDMEALQKALKGVDITAAQFNKTSEDGQKAMTDFGKGVKNGHQAMNTFAKTLKTANPALDSSRGAAKALTAEQKKLAENTKAVVSELNSMKKVPLGETIMNTVSGMAQAAAGASMLTSGISSLNQMFETGEHTLGGWLGAISSIGFALPMVVGGLKTLGAALGFTTAATAAQAAIDALANKNKEAGIVLSGQQLVAANAEAVRAAMNIPLKAAENLLDEQGNLKKSKAIALSISLKAAKLLEAAGIGVGIQAKIADAVASGSAAAATWAMIWPVGLLMAAVLALVGVIWLIVAAFQAMAANTPEAKLAAAKEEAKKAAEAFSEAQTAAQELRDTIEGYDSAVEKLEDCIEGTQEWKDALKEVNNQTLDLLSKYPQLATMEGALEEIAGGGLKVADWALDELQTQADQRVYVAQAAAVGANQNVRDANIEVDRSDYSKNLNKQDGTYAYVNYGDGSSDMSASVASTISKNIEELSQMTKDEQKAWMDEQFSGYTLNTDAWVEAIDDLSEESDALIASIDANTKAKEMENQAIASNYLQDNEKVQSSSVTEEVNEISGRAYEQLKQKALDKLDDDGWGTDGISKATGVNDEARKVWKEYLEAANLNANDYDLKDTTGTDGARAFVYNDKDGNEKSITLKAMKEIKASADALKEMGANAEAVAKELTKLETSTNAADKGIKDFVSKQNFEDSTKSEMDDLKSEVGNVNDAAAVEKYLDKKFGDGKDGQISDDTAKKYGYKSADAMVKAFQDGVKSYDTAITNAGKNLLRPVKEVFDDIDKSELSVSGQKAVGKVLEDAFMYGGDEGLAAMQETMSNMDNTELEKFSTTLSGIDWQTTTVSDLEEKLKTAGITTEFTKEELNGFIETLKDPNFVESVENLQKNYGDLIKVAGDLKAGDAISSEDFKTLDSDLQEYFTVMADGTYKLTGDALDFYQAVQDKSIESYVNNANTLKEQNSKLEGIKNYDLNNLQTTQSGTEGVAQQLEVLGAMGYDSKKLAGWQDGLENGTIDTSKYKDIAKAVQEYSVELGNLDSKIAENNAAILENEAAIASTCETIEDLNEAYQKGQISASTFTQASLELQEADKWEGMDPKEVESYAKGLQKASKTSKIFSKELETNGEAAEDVALYTMKMNKGIDKLADGFEDWSDVLKKSDEGSQEYIEAMDNMKNAMSDVLGVSEEFLSNDFIVKNMKDIELAAQGDAEAIDRLAIAASRDILVNLELQDEGVRQELLDLHSELSAEIPDIQVGATLDDGDFLAKATKIVQTAQMSADQANAFFRSMGFEPHFKTEKKQVERSKKKLVTHTEYSDYRKPEGAGFFSGKVPHTTTTWTEEIDDGTVKEWVEVPALTTDGSEPAITVTRTNSGGSSNYSSKNSGGKSPGSSGGGGGGSSSKTATKEKKNLADEGDFYHDINREIENLAENTDKLAEAKDRAFGDDKINLINQEIKAIDKEIAAQDKLIKRAEKKLELDKKELEKYGAKYDENGEITNYDEMLENEVNKYNAAVDEYNKKAAQKDAGTLSDEEWEKAQEDFDKAEERYSGFEEAVSTYETDLDIKDDAIEEKAAKIREKLDKQLEGIQYGVDVQIEVNDRDLKVLERLLDRLDDDLYDGVDRIANMSKQMDEQFDNIEIYKAGIRQTLVSAGADQAAVDAYMAGDSTAIQGLDLTEEQMQMLQDYTDGIMESEDAILELREEIENQTMATFDAWHEKIEKNGQAFEHATTMAESYKNIIDLVGKTRLNIDDSVLKDLEDTQMNAANGAMQNAKAQMETTQSALDKAKEELEKAKKRGNQDDIEKWEKDIETLNETLMADQEAFMSSWETALQTAADIFTAQMDRAFENLEDDLAGTFKSFDELNAAMDRQQQAADRFMDAGKKQYELSKLNRKLQQDLDKTDNTKAQKELLKLQKEIESYQESGVEMSERDLAALQKKYELKLAEIALEDAQNAKSQVRLTRDSEGNFGYVYTADESKVADAQQNYEDKLEENRQLAIEQNQQLSEAIVANRQAMVEALREIRQEDYADTEAYMQALQETTQFYKEQEAYLIGETQKVIERSQDIYTNDYLAYDGWSTQKAERGDAYYAAMEARQEAANEIEQLKASGQWEKLSEQQRVAYEEELRKADEQWLNLQNSQTNSYSIMGENADGWVSDQSLLMDTLGLNILEGVTKGEDGSQGTEGLSAALGSAEEGTGFFGESKAAAEKWEDSIKTIMGYAGIDISNTKNKANEGLGKDGAQKSFVDFKTAVTEALYGKGGTKAKPAADSVNGAMDSAKGKIDTLKTTAETQFGKVATSVTNWQTTYSGKIKTATTNTNNLNTAIQNLLGKEIEVIANTTKAQENVDKLKTSVEGLGDKTVTITTKYKTEGSSSSSSSSSSSNGAPDNSDKIEGVAAAIWLDGGSTSGWYVGSDRSSRLNNKGVIAAQAYINEHGPNGDLYAAWGKKRSQLKNYYYGAFDTGGYTGEWGPEGRLAILHQKEIVLNASDTENLLTAVQMIRDISGQLEANAMTMKYIKTLENYGVKINTGGQPLQQEVTIHAEFPNATNHAEIEEAFRNLSTLASQYANRKN